MKISILHRSIGMLILVLAAFSLTAANADGKTAKAPFIGEVPPTNYGCNLHSGDSGALIFMASFGTVDPGYWMNINGKATYLNKENSGAYFPDRPGEKSTLQFESGGLKVVLDVKNVTPDKKFAAAADYEYNGTLHVISPAQEQTIKVSGRCGS